LISDYFLSPLRNEYLEPIFKNGVAGWPFGVKKSSFEGKTQFQTSAIFKQALRINDPTIIKKI